MFKDAKALTSAPKTVGKKKEREVVELNNVEQLAQLHALVKAAQGAISAIEGTLKEEVFGMFLDRADGKKPDSFDAQEGNGMLNLQMRKRGTNSPLGEDECSLLLEAGLVPDVVVKTPELFAINPEFATDTSLLSKVEKALGKISGLPENFIVKQNAVVVNVVGDDLLEKAFKLKGVNRHYEEVIQMVTTLGFKPTLVKLVPGDMAKTIEEILEIQLTSSVPDELEKALVARAKSKAPTKTKKIAA